MEKTTDPLQLPMETMQALLKNRENESIVLRNENSMLKEEIRLLRHKLFGKSSEKKPDLEATEQTLFNEAEVFAPEEPKEENKEPKIKVEGFERNKPVRKALPEDLPREVQTFDLPEAEKVCPFDGTALKHIGEETSEKLDIIPEQIRVIKRIQLKYACPCCQSHIALAAKPEDVVPKGMPSSSTVAAVVVKKYCDGLPLYRQEKIFERLDVDVKRATLSNWVLKGFECVAPLVSDLFSELLKSPVLHMDETRTQVLKEKGRAATTQSFMWVGVGETVERKIIGFRYHPNRSLVAAQEFLQDFNGVLQSDGYEVYKNICSVKSLQRAGCMAHVRRKFFEAEKVGASTGKGLASEALAWIQKLYVIEREIKSYSDEGKVNERQARSGPILHEFKAWADTQLFKVPPKSKLGEAFHYFQNEFSALQTYLHNGRVEIDNNKVENAIRPFVIGRKNHLFSDTPRGADASAGFYSLLETAKANGRNPYKYLKAVFDELPNLPGGACRRHLLPWIWQEPQA